MTPIEYSGKIYDAIRDNDIQWIKDNTTQAILDEIPQTRQEIIVSRSHNVDLFSALLDAGFKIDLEGGLTLKHAISKKYWPVVDHIERRSSSPGETAKTIGRYIVGLRAWQRKNGIEPAPGSLAFVEPKKTRKRALLDAAQAPDLSARWDSFISTAPVRRKPKREKTALYSFLLSVGPEKLAASVCDTGATAAVGLFIKENTGKFVHASLIRETLIELFRNTPASSADSRRVLKKGIETLENWSRKRKKQTD